MKTHHITKDSSNLQIARTDNKFNGTTESKDHSMRNGIQIFNLNLDSDEKSFHNSIDTRHKRISSVPRSILQKKS